MKGLTPSYNSDLMIQNSFICLTTGTFMAQWNKFVVIYLWCQNWKIHRAKVQQLEEEKHQLILRSEKEESKFQELEQQLKELETRVEKSERLIQQLEEPHEKVTQEQLSYEQKNPPTEGSKHRFDHDKSNVWYSDPAVGGKTGNTVRERTGNGGKCYVGR